MRRGSQANGALMRIGPLGIFGVRLTAAELAAHARADAGLTHPHAVCHDSNVVYTAAVAHAIRTGGPSERIYLHALVTHEKRRLGPTSAPVPVRSRNAPARRLPAQPGWVLVALHNAFYQLLHAPSLEEGVVDTVRRGGDADTNAAIAGALFGALLGLQAIPQAVARVHSLVAARKRGAEVWDSLGRRSIGRPMS